VIIQNSSTKTQFSENAFISQPITYIVKRNDTVSTIAEENGISIDTVLWANDLSYTDVLKPGTELRIPRADGVLTTVRKGDTLESLADEYSTNPQLILEANWGLEPNENGEYILTVGEELFLPDGEIPEPEPIIADKPTSSGTTKYTGVLTPPKAGGTDTKVSKKRFLGWPVKGSQGYLSQCYSGWHNGVDIASVGNSKPDLAAAADGVVSFAGCQSGYCPPPGTEYGGSGLAWTVMIDHGNGLTSIYGHMNDIYVSSGQRVVAGQSIGQMGQSGLAYGVHVHFMLVKSGTWTTYNPAAYMVNSVCGY
jgi:murein DD-endopeptidase MepM/ murein hydrolase activator NlpD